MAPRSTSAAVSASPLPPAAATTPSSAMKPWLLVAGLDSAYCSLPALAARVMSAQVSFASGLSQPFFAASLLLTPTAMGDNMIFSCSLTLPWPAASLSRYFALANQAASGLGLSPLSPLSTSCVLSIVPPKRNCTSTPVAARICAASGSMSFRSLVASTWSVARALAGTVAVGGAGSSAFLPQAASRLKANRKTARRITGSSPG